MVWGKKKNARIAKTEEDNDEGLPEAGDEPEEEPEENLEELKSKLEALNRKKNDKKKMVKEEEETGEFSLSENEMKLVIAVLSATDEFAAYQKTIVGQQMAKIVVDYEKVMTGKNGIQDNKEE